jgi:exopolyphosphatase/guanosine-5'-triphosphate,3'-diphosphate pyrophosphatase
MNKSLIKAAFDLGSGAIKMTVAEVEVGTSRLLRVLHKQSASCMVSHSLAKTTDSRLDQQIQSRIEKLLIDLTTSAKSMGATEFTAIATAAFRIAKNAPEFFSNLQTQLDLPIHIVSQLDEGKIGYMSGLEYHNETERNLLVWDSGAGSFQISHKENEAYQIYKGEFGTSNVVYTMLTQVQNRCFNSSHSINPASLDDVNKLIDLVMDKMPEVPTWLSSVLNKPSLKVIGIGGRNSIFWIAEKLLGMSSYNEEDVHKAILSCINQSDADFAGISQCEMIIGKLILLYCVIKKLKIPAAHFQETAGSTLGLFSMPEYW